MSKADIVFSGIQPTGSLHLGNYCGALRNWVASSASTRLFCVVDMHAITVTYDKGELNDNVLKTAATYMACGVEGIIFRQSDVPEHTELAWLLGCICSVGQLSRMTQFKDKSRNDKGKSSVGLYSYPVLMASDILLYKATEVPVGEDQLQHLELTRDIADRFNRLYGDYFHMPKCLDVDNVVRIMGLKDASKKMSKSDPSVDSRINLDDSDDDVRRKIMRAKTDSELSLSLDSLVNRPEIRNLLTISYLMLDTEDVSMNDCMTQMCEKYDGKGFKSLKEEIAENIITRIAPIREKIFEILSDRVLLRKNIYENGLFAKEMASKNIKEIKRLMGISID